MSLPAAFVAVIIIWSTTPLTVKWSTDAGYLFRVAGRMTLGTLFCLALTLVLRLELPWHAVARRTYAVASIATYGAMLCVYWSARFVPSGLIAVLFGLTPLMTALLGRSLLGERSLTPGKIAGMLLGVIGLAVIFGTGTALGPRAPEGIAVLLLGVLINALSMVLVKRSNALLSPMSVTTGALLYATPLFLVTWLVFDGGVPAQLPAQALWSIVYLGLIASAFGFTLFYYLLKHTSATAVALLTLVSPVTALLLGNLIAQERVPPAVWLGTALVLGGLALNQWGDRRLAQRRPGV